MTRNCPGAVAAILVESVAVMVEVVVDCTDGCSWFGVFACIALPVMMLRLFCCCCFYVRYYRMWLGMKSSTIYCVYVGGEYSEKLWISRLLLMISVT